MLLFNTFYGDDGVDDANDEEPVMAVEVVVKESNLVFARFDPTWVGMFNSKDTNRFFFANSDPLNSSRS